MILPCPFCAVLQQRDTDILPVRRAGPATPPAPAPAAPALRRGCRRSDRDRPPRPPPSLRHALRVDTDHRALPPRTPHKPRCSPCHQH
eukprot:1438540-Prymnesium_polylepis.1